MAADQLTSIDTRGRRAAAQLNGHISATAIPDLDTAQSPDERHLAKDEDRGPRRAVAAGIAALVLLVAAIAVVLVGSAADDGGRAQRVDTVETGDRFILGEVPPGFVLTGARTGLDQKNVAPDDGTYYELYGPSGSIPSVAVMLNRGKRYASIPDLERIVVGDRPALRPSPGLFGAPAVLVDVAGVELAVIGKRVDQDVLEAIAATVEVDDGEIVADSPSLPDGWSPLGRHDGQLIPAVDTGVLAGPDDAVVNYLLPDEPSGAKAVLGVWTGRGDVLVDIAGVLAERAEQVTVRGHPAVLTVTPFRTGPDEEPQDEWRVVWSEGNRVLVRVAGRGEGIGRAEVLAAAEGVRPVDDADWADVTRQALTGNLGGTEDDVIGSGSFSDSSVWVLLAQPDGPAPLGGDVILSTSSSDDNGGGSMDRATGGDPGGPFFDGVLVGHFGVSWAGGVLRPGVATVEILDDEGAVMATSNTQDVPATAPAPLRDARWWVTEIPDGPVAAVAVARGRDGVEIDRVPLAD